MTDYYDLLYDFQREDVDKYATVRSFLDASEMGVGKTIKTVAFDQHYNPDALTLVVAPLGVLPHWRKHFMAAGLPVVQLDRKARDASFDRFLRNGNKVLLIHWEALQRRLGLLSQLQKVRWGLVVGDEVQFMQNRKSQQGLGIKSMRTKTKLALSGTPATTNITGYWNVLNWMYPVERWGPSSYWRYYKKYVDFFEDDHGYHHVKGPKNEADFLAHIDPYYIRHLKRDPCCPNHPQGVMPWLPDKSYTTHTIDLDPKIKRAYDNMKREMVAWVGANEDQPVVAANFIAKLVRMVQFTGAYAELDQEGNVRLSEPSPKLDVAMDIIRRTDKPIVVFSMYRQMVELLAKRLDREGISNGLYTGSTRSTRDMVLERFSAGNLRCFLATIGAGGVGLDGLQFATDTVVFLDRDWSPARNVQAEDRLWRDGQKNAVNVIDIVTQGTIELGRRQDIQEKWSWLKRLLGDSQRVQEEVGVDL